MNNTTQNSIDEYLNRKISSDQTNLYFWGIMMGLFFSFVITEILGPNIFNSYIQSYKHLPRPKLIEWNTRWLSTVHATYILIISSCFLCFKTEMIRDRFFYTDIWQELGICLSCGYMIYDCFTMLMYLRGISLIMYLVHHGVVIYGSWAIISYKLGTYYAYLKYLTELSTPFINLRWCLRTVGYSSDEKNVAITTLLFTSTFVMTRNIGAIPFWYSVLHNMFYEVSLEKQMVIKTLFAHYFILGILLDILNLIWGYIVCKLGWEAFKVLRKTNKYSQYKNSLEKNN